MFSSTESLFYLNIDVCFKKFVLGQTEPAEPPNRTPDPAAPSDLVLLLGTNRMRPG